MDLDHDLDAEDRAPLAFWWEVARFRVGPDRTFRGVPCSISTVELVQVKADPCPFKPMRLFRWSRRRG